MFNDEFCFDAEDVLAVFEEMAAMRRGKRVGPQPAANAFERLRAVPQDKGETI